MHGCSKYHNIGKDKYEIMNEEIDIAGQSNLLIIRLYCILLIKSYKAMIKKQLMLS